MLTEAELVKMKQVDQSKLLSLADFGEGVFVNGLGEGLIAYVGKRAVLRFPLTMAGAGDAVFPKADKYTVPGYIYYIVPSKILGEQTIK